MTSFTGIQALRNTKINTCKNKIKKRGNKRGNKKVPQEHLMSVEITTNNWLTLININTYQHLKEYEIITEWSNNFSIAIQFVMVVKIGLWALSKSYYKSNPLEVRLFWNLHVILRSSCHFNSLRKGISATLFLSWSKLHSVWS